MSTPPTAPKKKATRKRAPRQTASQAPAQASPPANPPGKDLPDQPVDEILEPLPPLPYVIVNMAMTADGKIASAKRGVTSFGSAEDQNHLFELRATADAVMAGARTVDTDAITMGPGADKYRQMRLQAGLQEYNLRIVVTGAGTIDQKAEIFQKKFSPIILLTTERISRIRLKELSKLVDQVKVFGCNAIDFVAALRWLRAHHGVKRLLVEGGGDLNDAVFRAGVVDELHLTVCPLILGGWDAPTIAEGLGIERLPKAIPFELQSMKPIGDEIFLVYRKKQPPPPRVAAVLKTTGHRTNSPSGPKPKNAARRKAAPQEPTPSSGAKKKAARPRQPAPRRDNSLSS